MSVLKGQLIVFHDSTDDKDHSPQCGKMTPEEKKNFHKRNYRVTVVGHLAPNNMIRVGIACCSGKDTFNRKKGRELAEKRLTASPIDLGSIVSIKEDSDHKRFSRAVKLIKSFTHDIRKKAMNHRHSDLHSIIQKQK